MQCKLVALAGLEIQRTGKRNHQLSHRRGVPGKRAAGSRFLKRNARRVCLAAQPVAARAGLEIDRPLLETGIAVVPGPQPNTANHRSTSAIARNTASWSARELSIA